METIEVSMRVVGSVRTALLRYVYRSGHLCDQMPERGFAQYLADVEMVLTKVVTLVGMACADAACGQSRLTVLSAKLDELIVMESDGRMR